MRDARQGSSSLRQTEASRSGKAAAARKMIDPVYRTIGFPDSSALIASSAKPAVDQTPPAKKRSATSPTKPARRRSPQTAAAPSGDRRDDRKHRPAPVRVENVEREVESASQPPAAERRRRRPGGDVVPARPDPPREDCETPRRRDATASRGHCRGREKTNAAASTQAARRDPFALRVRGAGEQHCRRREPPTVPVAEPQDEEQGGDDDEDVQQDVGLGRQQPLAEARHDEHEQERRPEKPRRCMPMEQPGDRGDRADDEEPELHVQGDDVRAAHRMEGGRVEDRAGAAGTTGSAPS